jgi:subtilisin family serine protease
MAAALSPLLAACITASGHVDSALRMSAAERERDARQIVVTIADDDVRVRNAAGASPRPYATNGYAPSAQAQRVAAELARQYGLEHVAAWRINALGVHCVVFEVGGDRSRDALLATLRRDPRVESAQPMQRFVTAEREGAYNDPYYRLQTGVEALQVSGAHRWSHGRGVRVAVIDTGMDVSHPELSGRVRLTRNFVDDDDAQFRRDRHGTAVAGVLAATVNNGVGIVGVAPEVEILAFKACWHREPGGPAMCNTLTLAAALAAALENGTHVINLSLWGPSDPLLGRLVQKALKAGITVVAPANGADAQRSFPLHVPGVLAVADASEGSKESSAHLAAPGRDVLTLTPAGHYDYVSGASLSSAMVSGVTALLLERRRDMGPVEVAALLEKTAHIASDEPRQRIVNACDAVAAVIGSAGCSVTHAHNTAP